MIKLRFLLLALCVALFAFSGATAKSLGRVVARDHVPHDHRDQEINKLQKIKGWPGLRFAKDPASRKVKRYWLTWDFAVVGGFSASLNRLARSSANIF